MPDRYTILANALQANGYRLTNARRAIVTALIAGEGHLSADELVDLVHRDAPGIGRMTVYRTLELLTHLGLIRPIYHGSAAARYILMEEGHHHHLVCSSCDQIIEFDACVWQEIEQAIGQHYHFEVQGHLLEIFGRCQRCRA